MKHRSSAFSFSPPDVFRVLCWACIIFITWTFMHGADHFLELTPEALGKYFSLRWVLIMHITAGGGALILGPPQFSEKLMNHYKRLHRINGVLYLLAILVSAVCALILAFTTSYAVNRAYAFSLQVWASVWITASFVAYRAALKRKFKLHKEWMMRSYIVTLAFVVSGLLVKLPWVQQLGSFEDISPSLFWFGWAVPLYVYEMILAAKRKS